jgi:hypothetical protein
MEEAGIQEEKDMGASVTGHLTTDKKVSLI